MFRDRREAGEKLAAVLAREPVSGKERTIVLGIPRGGVAVGFPVARRLECRLEPVTVRKLPLPGNDQMGFGAVALDRNVVINEELVAEGYVLPGEIPAIIDEVHREVLRRERAYRGTVPFPGLSGLRVIVADDGLATGYTMLAALRFAHRNGAKTVEAAVPVAHAGAYRLVEREAERIVCLHIDTGRSFAVASFYEEFPDLDDREVIAILRTANEGRAV